MNMNDYLWDRVARCYLTPAQEASIQTSIKTLRNRVFSYFQGEVTHCIPFGSYVRGTNLTRSIDSESDVDIMLVFANAQFRPQTYLNRIRSFVTASYPSSDVEQSAPTIRLNLDHIRFEIVPALANFYGFQIPAPTSNYAEWMQTDPDAIEKKMVERDASHQLMVKPTAMLLKSWNVTAGRPFGSFELENWLAGRSLPYASSISSFFGDAALNINSYLQPQWVANEVSRLHRFVSDAIQFANNGYHIEAANTLKRAFRESWS